MPRSIFLTVITVINSVLFSQFTIASGSEPSTPPEIVTVTTTRVPIQVQNLGASVAVFTSEQLERLESTTVSDLLRNVPSVTVVSSGSAGAQTSVFIRGEDSYRTQLWLDGINLSDTSTPQVMPRFDALIGGRWQRLEVLRGPQGLIYGADAGGVVNLISASPEGGAAADVVMEAGGYDSQKVNANVRLSNGTVAYVGNASQYSTRGFNVSTLDSSNDMDGSNNTTWHNKFWLNVDAKNHVELVYRNVEQKTEYDQCYNLAFTTVINDCVTHQAQWSGRAAWYYQTEHGQHQVAVSQNDFQQKDYANVELVANKGGMSRNWQYFAHYRFGKPLTLTWGADYKEESFVDEQWRNAGERWQKGIYVEGLVSVTERFFYNIAARYDDHEQFGSHDNYRISTAYLIPLADSQLKLKAAYGTGFRAPSLYEQSEAADDNSLRQEDSHGGEIGVEYLAEAVTLAATLFQSEIENRIEYDVNSGYRQVNGESRSRGIELVANWAILRNLELQSSYTFNQTQMDHSQGDNPRARRPQNSYQMALQSEWLADALQVDVTVRGSRNAYELGQALDDYDVLSIVSHYRFNRLWEVYATLENVTDEYYQQQLNFNTGRRKASLGTRISF